MELFERFAPRLLRCAFSRLALSTEERSSIRHVIVTCCTGLFAPGLDFTAIEYLGLDPATERMMVGFMGCYITVATAWRNNSRFSFMAAILHNHSASRRQCPSRIVSYHVR